MADKETSIFTWNLWETYSICGRLVTKEFVSWTVHDQLRMEEKHELES